MKYKFVHNNSLTKIEKTKVYFGENSKNLVSFGSTYTKDQEVKCLSCNKDTLVLQTPSKSVLLQNCIVIVDLTKRNVGVADDHSFHNAVAVTRNGNQPLQIYGIVIDDTGCPYTMGDREVREVNPVKRGDKLVNNRGREITVTYVADDGSFAYEYLRNSHKVEFASAYMSINDHGSASYGIEKALL